MRDPNKMPGWITNAVVVLVAASWIPLAAAYLEREKPNASPRVSIIPDMDSQQKFKAQQANLMFNDKRADRQAVPGTVARGELRADRHYYEGIVNGQWAPGLPSSVAVSEVTLNRGRDRYNIYCAPCHGYSGHGDGMVAVRATELAESGADMAWTPPKSMHDPVVRQRPDGYFFGVITNGVRNMPPYGPQIDEADRWAIVLYVRALQKTQAAGLGDVAAGERSKLEMSRDEAIQKQQSEAAASGAATAPPADGSAGGGTSGSETDTGTSPEGEAHSSEAGK
jgi:mono/diheme cytochrome c family protein